MEVSDAFSIIIISHLVGAVFTFFSSIYFLIFGDSPSSIDTRNVIKNSPRKGELVFVMILATGLSSMLVSWIGLKNLIIINIINDGIE